MSTGAAIAATTQLIRMALQNFLPDLSGALGGQPGVSALPPDRITTGSGEPVQLNVFFYRADLNSAWRNVAEPMRSGNGARLTQPPLGLNLHYLISAYAKQDLQAEILLGHAMEVLHGFTGLTAATITQRLAGPRPSDVPAGLWQLIAASGLDRQADQVTISLEPQSTDDISKLWSVLGEKYRPSAAYVVTVVLIQPQGATTTGLPVTRIPQLAVAVRNRPALVAALPDAIEFAAGREVVLQGSNLVGAKTKVLLGNANEVDPEAGSTPERLVVKLAANQRAGVVGARVRHAVLVGAEERDFEFSNAITLSISPVPGNPSVVAAGGGLPARLRLPLTPAVAPGQDGVLKLNATDGSASLSITALPLPGPGSSGTVDFPIDGVPPGTYLFRVSVDDSESALTADATGTFTGPTVVIP